MRFCHPASKESQAKTEQEGRGTADGFPPRPATATATATATADAAGHEASSYRTLNL